ncbi:UNVERIFIED_CONTAM: hypothetical protein Slati_1318900, partial [Sesamum latifolium]
MTANGVIQEGWQWWDRTSHHPLLAKQRACAARLQAWSQKQDTRLIRKQILSLEEQLGRLQKGTITSETKQTENRIRAEVEQLLSQEEVFWKQRGKIHWLREGDMNTSFFHNQASTRKWTNAIDRIQNGEGQWLDKEEDIQNHIEAYFNEIFRTRNPLETELEKGTEGITARISDSILQELLHPKPETLTQFRPISLCNVAYKIASKAIANRLKSILDAIISPCQAAFVPGRLITDNVLLAFEVNHYLNTKTWGKKGHMALKLDISNAYDKNAEHSGKLQGVAGNHDVPSSNLFETRYGNAFVVGMNVPSLEWGKKFSSRRWLKLSPRMLWGVSAYRSRLLRRFSLWCPIFGGSKVTDRKYIGLIGRNFSLGRHKEVLSASVGRNPSYTWRSIWATQHIVRGGFRWRIRSGQSVHVWKDPWLPRPFSFWALCHASNLSQMREEADSILAIPLSHIGGDDFFVWHHTTTGQFSVRSAYHVAVALSSQPHPSTSTSKLPIWSSLWKTKVPRKIQAKEEDTQHTFLRCPYARQVWCLYHLRWAIIFVFSSSPSDWIAYMVAHLSKEELEIFFTIYWALWWNRNRTLMERITLPPVELLTFALNYINSFRQVNALPACIARRTAPSSWTPPDTGWIKLNCDGAIFAAESEIGLGVVARDERGSCVGWKAL